MPLSNQVMFALCEKQILQKKLKKKKNLFQTKVLRKQLEK